MKFLEEIAERLIALHHEQLEDVVLCFPNNRVGFYFQKILCTKLNQAAFLPKIITLTDFIYSFSAIKLSDPLSLKLILHKHYSNIIGENDISKTLSLADTFLSDFEELAANAINEKSFFKNLSALKSMNVVFEDNEEAVISYQRFWKNFEQLYFSFNADLLQQKIGYNGLICKAVAEQISNHSIDFKQIYFIGFTTLSVTEEKIIRYFCEKNIGNFWADVDEYYFYDKEHSAGNFYRKYAAAWWKNEEQFLKNELQSHKKEINIIGVAKNIGQAKVAANFVANHPNQDTAIVLLDSSILLPLIFELPKETENYNISMGIPFQQTNLYAFLSIIQKLIYGKIIEKDVFDPLFYYEDVIALFSHSFLQNILATSTQCTKIISHVKQQNIVYIPLSTIEQNIHSEKEHSQFIILLQQDNAVQLNSTFSIILHNIAKYLTTNQNEYIEQEAIKNLLVSVDSFEIDLLQLLNERDYFKLLQQETASIRIPIEPEYNSPLQILGIMETRGFDFENVVLVSCNEGIFPTGKSLQSYIPFELRTDGITTHYTKESIAAYLFYRLLHYAKKITIIYNTQSDRLGGGEISRFVMQLENEFDGHSNFSFTKSIFTLDGEMAVPPHPIIIQKTPAVIAAIKTYITNSEKGLSPSAIATYNRCSLQFYFNYILKIKEENEVDENIASHTFGTVLHSVLERVYTPFINRVLKKEDILPYTDKNTIRNLLINAFKEERYEENNLLKGKNYLALILSEEYLFSFFNSELSRIQSLAAKNETITVKFLEAPLKGSIDIADMTVVLNGKSDRIELINGDYYIWDYKTGKQNSLSIKSIQSIADPKNEKLFQLMMYAYLSALQFEIPSLHSGIIWLIKSFDKYELLTIDNNVTIQQNESVAFKEILHNILSEMVNPAIEISQTENVEFCSYCAYKDICNR